MSTDPETTSVSEPEIEAQRSADLRRAVIGWGALMILLFVTLFAAMGSVGRDYFSPAGFVRGYLTALAAGDLERALGMPGVDPSSSASTRLLRSDVLGELSDITLVGDQEVSPGQHLVTFSYGLRVPGEQDEPAHYESSFLVEQHGTEFGLFTTWRFAESPVRTLQVTVRHDWRFSVNGVDLELPEPEQVGHATLFLVTSPGLYRLDHDTEYFTGTAVDAVVTGGERASATIALEPTPTLIDAVQAEVDRLLAECTTQTVLFPTGCPFGKFFSDRIQSDPAWSIVTLPVVEVVDTADGWLVPEAEAVAHLKVEVQDLFDGSLYDFDEDVPFSVSYRLAIDSSGEITLSAAGR